MLSGEATVERFKAQTTPITCAWLDDQGNHCARAQATMALLQRQAGSGSMAIRIEAADAAKYIPELVQ